MYGNQYSPRNNRGGNCDDLIKKYSNKTIHTVIADDESVEVVRDNNTSGRPAYPSSETAELIKKATVVQRDTNTATRYSHSMTPRKDDPVQRMLQNYQEQLETPNSTKSHMTPSAPHHTFNTPAPHAYDEARRLLSNARKFESEINRVALEPPACYSPRVTPRLDGMKMRGYNAQPHGETYSGRNAGFNRSSNGLVKSFHDYNPSWHGINSRPTSDVVRNYRSSTSVPTTGINPILKDVNFRSKELKDLLDREKNLELSKSSTWSDIRLSDIDSRLEFLKKRCSDLRGCTEMSKSHHDVMFAGVYDPKAVSHSFKDTKSLETINAILNEKVSQAVKPVAFKVLSERVLCGYRITSETCAICGVSKLAKRDSNDRAECVFCIIDHFRTQVRNGIARKVLSYKLTMGPSTLSRGKLCELCISPTLVQADGTMICEVCPVLDTICVEVTKEQSQGGQLISLPCRECNASMMSSNSGLKCLACTVMREWQQQQKLQHDKIESSAQEASTSIEQEQGFSTVGNNKQDEITRNCDLKKERKNDLDVDAVEQTVQQTEGKSKIFESLMGQYGDHTASSPDKDVRLNISNLQSQLLQELAKAKQCQIVLENSINDPNANQDIESQAATQKQLEEELAKAKRCQYALQRIIDTTSNMDQFPSVDDPNEIDDMMSAPELKRSFSISQQEVEAGEPKEYIPPPSFFRSGIPSMVEVTLIPPTPDTNLAEAYETNLKKTDNDKKLVSKSRVGIDFWPFTKAVNHNEELEQGGFDYDTIQTDDFTVDYTLNTMDNSRLEYLHIRSKQTNRVRFKTDEEQEKEAQAAGCSFMDFFGCGSDSYDESEGRQDDVVYHHHQERQDAQRENPSPSFDDNPSRIQHEQLSRNGSMEDSATSTTVSRQSSISKGPAWIGRGDEYSKNSTMQEPSAANDYSEISDVSEHVIRSKSTRNAYDRFNLNKSPSLASQRRDETSECSAASSVSGSMYRMQDANSVLSGNSGSFVKSSGRNSSGPNRRYYGERFSSKMGTLLEDESVDSSIDKYIINPSVSCKSAEMKKIIQEFERSNQSSFFGTLR